MQWRSARLGRILVPSIVAIALAACDTNSDSTGPRIATMKVVSGNGQSGPIGGLLPLPLVTRVEDQHGDPVAGAVIVWAVTTGNGSVLPATDTTDADGNAETTLRLGSAVGVQTVTATLQGLNPVSFAANATAAPASQLTVLSGDAQNGQVGSQLPDEIAVKVTDAFANPKAGVPVTFTVLAGGGTVSGTAVLSDAEGIAKVRWTLGTIRGNQTVSASTGSLTPVTFTASASPDDPIQFLVVSGANQVATPGAPLGDSIVVRLVDQFGNGVGGVEVNWVVTAGNGSVSPTSTVTNNDGRTATKWTVGPSGGPKSLSVQFEGIQTTISGAAFITFGKVTAAGRSSCGIDDGGVMYCWGFNGDGQLGIEGPLGAGPVFAVPQAVPPVTNQTFAMISGGLFHTCGVTFSHNAYCWGDNVQGQLGIGTNTRSNGVELVDGAIPFATASAGRVHSCGFSNGGRAYCWGDNERGQLGASIDTVGGITFHDANAPVEVGTMTDGKYYPGYPGQAALDFISIAAGGVHTCAVNTANVAWCWGLGREGQRGDGQSGSGALSQYIPMPVTGGVTYDSITAGFAHTCARTTGGTVQCWGDNSKGQLGTGGGSLSSNPVGVAGGFQFVAITAGHSHTCGIAAGGAALCWGDNSKGQLGDGTTDSQVTPQPVEGGHAFKELIAGDFHTCGVTINDVAYCWGDNQYGAIGDGTQTNRRVPTKVRFQR